MLSEKVRFAKEKKMSNEQLQELDKLIYDIDENSMNAENLMLQFEPETETYNVFSAAVDDLNKISKQLQKLKL